MRGSGRRPAARLSARIGPREGLPTYATPSLTHDLHFAWKLVITAQDGPAFAGYNTGPSGKPKDLVGVFRADGVRFAMSTDGGAATGEVDGDKLEFCFTRRHSRLRGRRLHHLSAAVGLRPGSA